MATYQNTEYRSESGRQTVRRVVSVILAILALLLLFRIVFRVLGANDDNAFVSIIYQATAWAVAPFKTIFPETAFTGLNQNGVFEPGSLIALVLVLIIGVLVLLLIAPKAPEASYEVERKHEDADLVAVERTQVNTTRDLNDRRADVERTVTHEAVHSDPPTQRIDDEDVERIRTETEHVEHHEER